MLELYSDYAGRFEWLYSHWKFLDIMVIEVQGNQTQAGLVCLQGRRKSGLLRDLTFSPTLLLYSDKPA